jgi:hypothetical protein
MKYERLRIVLGHGLAFLAVSLAWGLLLFALMGCAVKIKTTPVQVNPIEVNHKIDTSGVEAFYKISCAKELQDGGLSPSDPTYQTALDQCVAEEMAGWFAAYNSAVN